MRISRGGAHAHAPSALFQRRWFRALVGALAVWMLLLSTWCLIVASRPGNESFIAKAADWARDNHLSGVVNWVEARYYSWVAPPKGGQPHRAIEVAVAPPTTATTGTTAVVRPHSAPPANVTPLASPPVENEGVWSPIGPMVDGFPTVLAAQLRPDNEHTSVLGAVAWLDPRLVRFELIPGKVEPGGVWTTGGRVPDSELAHLVGAFNGGFRFRDAHGGFYAEGREEHPLAGGAASIVVRRDGTMDVGQWGRDDAMGPDVVTVRQNLVLIVDGGRPVDDLDASDAHRWGNTLGNKVLVWRSGVGIRPDGTIVYAASNGLSVYSLAVLLAQAGCLRAMELDINPEWVTYDVFDHPDPANPAATRGALLLPDMQRAPDRYLHEDSRDFVAVLTR